MTNYPGGEGGPQLVVVSPRQQYRRARTRRKTIIYGSAILGLAAALLFGALGLAGSLLTGVDSEFNRPVVYAKPGGVPCPTAGARPTAPDGVWLNVYNTTATPGLAGEVAAYFEEVGYNIGQTDNAPIYRGVALIETGPRAVDDAYTLARFFGPETKIRLTGAEDKTLTVLLGDGFRSMPDEEETEQILQQGFALVPRKGCLPVAEPEGGWAVPPDLIRSQSEPSEEVDETEEAEDADSE